MQVFERLDRGHDWDDAEAAAVETVARLAREEIQPRAAEFDRTKAFPWSNVKAINALGLNGLFIPEAYGGAAMRTTFGGMWCWMQAMAPCSKATFGLIPRQEPPYRAFTTFPSTEMPLRASSS